MKTTLGIVLAALVGTVSLPALADNETPDAAAHNHAGHGMAASQMTEGLVKKVDKSAGKLTLSHGPLPNGMPGMTMVFRVKDPAWLDQVKAGDTIHFMAEQINGAMTVVHLQRD
ncbi:MAG: copper-binding protein [Proteobacteria bacterium]|uniref:copper-binding protein n=1 Tax=unclassified Zoogloea TaxID=2640915 RepID=UPI0009A48593|nr:copper-binding protein [Zoogloea sp. LCSB751]MBS0349337.1 copper-binding protein [Pseudomonadota bacterium]MBS0370600.1 copper-binding protein [Pseudomonadota bacterium]